MSKCTLKETFFHIRHDIASKIHERLLISKQIICQNCSNCHQNISDLIDGWNHSPISCGFAATPLSLRRQPGNTLLKSLRNCILNIVFIIKNGILPGPTKFSSAPRARSSGISFFLLGVNLFPSDRIFWYRGCPINCEVIYQTSPHENVSLAS